mgnify:CR=1 FL=1
MEILKILHLLGVVVWVGGMFFAYMVLRPVVNKLLPSPEMLKFWQAVFTSFFHWVWLSITVIFASGVHMISELGGFDTLPFNVYLMFAIGSMMMLIFLYVFFCLYNIPSNFNMSYKISYKCKINSKLFRYNFYGKLVCWLVVKNF